MAELERRVKALAEAAVAEGGSFDQPRVSEEELITLYQDLLEIPAAPTSSPEITDVPKITQLELDFAIVKKAEERICDMVELADTNHDAPRLSSILHNEVSLHRPHAEENTGLATHRRILFRLEDFIVNLETVRSNISVEENAPLQPNNIIVSPLSKNEWESLIRVCSQARDSYAATLSLDLMKRSGLPQDEKLSNGVLEMFAAEGDIKGTEKFIALNGSPTEYQRHLHVKCHLNSYPAKTNPTSALEVLHDYESKNLPAPMRTYTRLITYLFALNSSFANAQAWDLFSHMRYVAHATPDAMLYTIMIRACAFSPSLMARSEPERALDLWTEMTVDKRIAPTVWTYNAVILACARSGSREYVTEAFRLAKEMLDAHRDAEGRSAYTPNEKTFCALLIGAKRVGDLPRARWILVEMFRCAGEETNRSAPVVITDAAMVHIFHAYSAYRPPFKRSAVVSVDPKSLEATQSVVDLDASAQSSSFVSTDQPEITFSHLPPQSRSETLAEAKTLFERIVHNATDRRFQHVRLTTRLLNAYLSIYYSHAPLHSARDLFKPIFEEHGLERDALTYVEALERCATAESKKERSLALEFAHDIWRGWELLEKTRSGFGRGSSADARMIERAHIAMIRVLTLNWKVDEVVAHVKHFFDRYSPRTIYEPQPKLLSQSTRTVLFGARPLVRMTSPVEIRDDAVPPLLTFSDLEVLHHRLVVTKQYEAIHYLKYLCKAYEGALRARRDERVRAVPPKSSRSLGKVVPV